MDWSLIAFIAYVVILVIVCLRIIYDTRATAKTLAYLLLAIFAPIFGILFYFAFGVNRRKRKLYSKKLVQDESLFHKLQQDILRSSKKALDGDPDIRENKEMARLLLNDSLSPPTAFNRVKLLVNGENKFPEVLDALSKAKDHIHIEYYIFDDDTIGQQIKEVLIKKAKEGVKIRFIYDDFGSGSIRRTLVPELKAAGAEAFPFYRTLFFLLANRYNYRNHRKIIVIDGNVGFVGGINVSDRYINNGNKLNEVFWRDTHIRIDGPGVYFLQYLFLCDWNFCASTQLQVEQSFFSGFSKKEGNTAVQIAASGPDSDMPTILFAFLQAIHRAEKEVLLTTPYFIPGESLMHAITVAALSGVKVKLLLPGVSDSRFIDFAARSYYEEMLDAGVEIYLYQKGFMHAKTLIIDSAISIVGSANLDIRSLELNFEVNAIVYDTTFSENLRAEFCKDLNDSRKLDPEAWKKRPHYQQLLEKLSRLFSALM